MKIDTILEEYLEWLTKQFDTSGRDAIIHLEKEVFEFTEESKFPSIDNQDLALEAADVIFLVVYVANKRGLKVDDLRKAMSDKLKINKLRNWNKNEDGTYSHVKTA